MFGRDANFPTAPEDQDRYIRYTLARLAPYWNILLMVGGPEPHLKNKRYLSDDEINWIGRSIRDNDPFGHLLSVHNPTGDDSFRQEDWVSYVILQGPKTVDREQLRDDQLSNRNPEKPLFAQETLWPYFCLTGQSNLRALSRFALSGQLLSGAKRSVPSEAPPRPSATR